MIKISARLFLFMCLSIAICFSSHPSFAVEFYDNATNAPDLQFIQSATSHLDIETYTMEDPVLRQTILDAQSRGVQVRIVQEPSPVGASCKIFADPSSKDPAGCDDLRAFVSQVQAAGGQYVPYNKSAFCNGTKTCYEHGKMMLIDQKAALVSTGNFDNTSFCDTANGATRCNRDFTVITEDPNEVQALVSVFNADFSGQEYDLESIVQGLPSMSLTISPYSLSPLVAFVQSAQSSIQVENQYLHDADFNQALEQAASRGVKVQLMVSSICSFGKPSNSAVKQATSLASEFANAGIDARVFTKNIQINGIPGYLHAKAIVVDGNAAWVGSVNGSKEAFEVNREFGVFFNDQQAVSALSSIMSADFSNSGSTTLADDASCY